MQLYRIVIATLVTLVWLVGYGLAFYKGSDQPDGLNILMGLVLGWVFGGATFDALKRIRIERKKDDEEDERTPDSK